MCAPKCVCVRAFMRGHERRSACMIEWMWRDDGSSHRCWSCNSLIEALLGRVRARFLPPEIDFPRNNFNVAFSTFIVTYFYIKNTVFLLPIVLGMTICFHTWYNYKPLKKYLWTSHSASDKARKSRSSDALLYTTCVHTIDITLYKQTKK